MWDVYKEDSLVELRPRALFMTSLYYCSVYFLLESSGPWMVHVDDALFLHTNVNSRSW